MKIEIYERATGEVVETKEVNKLESFMFYWNMQCDNVNYGWRKVNEVEN